jgi:hypothetical protein
MRLKQSLDRHVKHLLAPPVIVARELNDKAAAIAQAEKILVEAKEMQKRYAEVLDELK